MIERYLTIARELRLEIERGCYKPGDMLPGRLALAEHFSTTRGTIDRSIRFLISQGVVSSRRGSGTYVAKQAPKIQLALVGETPDVSEPEEVRLHIFSTESVRDKSDREKLLEYDGIIWYLPPQEVLSWRLEFPPEIPQIIINRDYPETNYVTTDHRGAVRKIMLERLERLPDSIPCCLCPQERDSVIDAREAGFVDACRIMQRFYECISLPDTVDEIIDCLDDLVSSLPKSPLLFSGCKLMLTGGVMAWARCRGHRWGKDIFYHDFDNEYPENVWGLRVTTFLQDYQQLINLAVENIQALIRSETKAVQLFIPPLQINGDT